jgi:hypothetical protein
VIASAINVLVLTTLSLDKVVRGWRDRWSYQMRLDNQMIVGAGLGVSFKKYQKPMIKTHPYRFYGLLTEFDIIFSPLALM